MIRIEEPSWIPTEERAIKGIHFHNFAWSCVHCRARSNVHRSNVHRSCVHRSCVHCRARSSVYNRGVVNTLALQWTQVWTQDLWTFVNIRPGQSAVNYTTKQSYESVFMALSSVGIQLGSSILIMMPMAKLSDLGLTVVYLMLCLMYFLDHYFSTFISLLLTELWWLCK